MITKHQQMVRTLTKPPEAILASLTPAKCNLLHATNGLADEYFELQIAISVNDKENILEELGDMLFYTEAFIIDVEVEPFPPFKPLTIEDTMQKLYQITKRHIFYEQDLDKDSLYNIYLNIKSWIQWYASQIGKTIRDVEIHNMSKLGERYKNFEYSDKAAKERKDKQNASA